MPSPFPGMDPFIESQKWEDFHTRFITAVGDALVPAVRPKYVVEVQRRLYLETREPDWPVRSIVPDAGIITRQSTVREQDDDVSGGVAAASETDVQAKTCVLPYQDEHREAFLTIRHGSPSEVVTVIELLSPANKLRRARGRELYLDKRMGVLATKVHWVELDLLRGGERMPFSDPPDGDYFAMVSRAARRPLADVYGWRLSHRMPTIPIPLLPGDADAVLDLQAVFDLVYDRAGYDYSLDYQQAVRPALSDAEVAWAAGRIASRLPAH